ncbi:alpha/beta fold hydrolase [Sphingomonas abietis]|uniref:Alpha/beta fold hydrolase n=1 Tax=Sphingomonas abietis TaxID=3012344 RepID=A0ABY7NN01_9SPHN|nr:alpha/beta fold hydrolase [Sphingomonas abietis]WBO22901.1 alpha/beta fold hydrolase [Sphingomonas abietis]
MTMTNSTSCAAPAWHWIRTGVRAGPTVLLIHAVGLDLTFWDKQIEALRDAYDVIAVDLPGHGRSSAPPSDWSFEQAAATLVSLMEELAVDAAHIVGLSIGGMIAQQIAADHPARVKSLTLLATAATFPDEARAGMVEHATFAEANGMEAVLPFLDYWLAAETIQGHPDVVDRVSTSLLRMEPAVYASIWRMIAGFDVLERLGTVRCPTLVLVGDRDLNTPTAYAQMLAAAVEQGSSTVLPGGSHLLPLDVGRDVTTKLESFLARTEASCP